MKVKLGNLVQLANGKIGTVNAVIQSQLGISYDVLITGEPSGTYAASEIVAIYKEAKTRAPRAKKVEEKVA